MTIKEVAIKTNLNPQTIRYYEKLGLIYPLRNQENLYRIYTEDDIYKLKLIKKLQTLHFTLKEIKDFFKLMDNQNSCQYFENLLSIHINKINKQIEELKKLKQQLNHYLTLCKKNPEKHHCISLKELI
ncbi:MAG: putative heavy metal-dependent transcriptional regulator [Leptospiraceae bacterium]|nr:MAG: putative heavy metal-dependent transcriptional regulator [Leptospiraceae bacterium]